MLTGAVVNQRSTPQRKHANQCKDKEKRHSKQSIRSKQTDLPTGSPQHTNTHLVKANVAAVEVVGAIVCGQCVLLAIESELALGDAVAVASDNSGEVRPILCDPVFEIAKAQHNVNSGTVTVGHAQRREDLSHKRSDERKG